MSKNDTESLVKYTRGFHPNSRVHRLYGMASRPICGARLGDAKISLNPTNMLEQTERNQLFSLLCKVCFQ